MTTEKWREGEKLVNLPASTAKLSIFEDSCFLLPRFVGECCISVTILFQSPFLHVYFYIDANVSLDDNFLLCFLLFLLM